MALYLSPLIDVNEVDLTTTIPAVATSIAVNVLRDTWKGPENKKTLITLLDDLTDTFGEPTGDSYKDMMACAGYLKYGNTLYCTRVMPPSASFAGVYASVSTSGATTFAQYTTNNAYILSDLAAEDPDELADESVLFDSGRPEQNANMMIIANSRGSWGNYTKVAIVGKDSYDYVTKGTTPTSGAGLSTDLYDDVADVSTPFERDSNTEFLVIVKTADQEDINKSNIPYTVRETFLVSTDPLKVDDEGKNIFAENVINDESDYIRIAIRSTLENADMSSTYTADYTLLAGGRNNNSDSVTDADIMEAYELYEDPEVIDVNIFIDSDKSTTVKQRLISICESRLDSMAVLDVPSSLVINNKGNETTDMRDFRLGLHNTYNLNENTSYAALYGNWLNVYDKWNATYRWIPASGHIAGIYANTDNVSESWFAPAGLNRAVITNVRKLAFNPTQGERDILYKNGINPIVSFAGQGKVVWGQKNMLDKSSAFNRVNVRRLFIVLEKAISTAAKYFLFEPNDEFTRLLLVDMISPFLRDVKARRGIYDFLVVCDTRNNTAERIDRNELWCDIYVKPVKASEFIVLNFIATKTSASFTELVAQSTP